jgi:hypothetical protein
MLLEYRFRASFNVAAPATIELSRSTTAARFRWSVLLIAIVICAVGAIRSGIFRQSVWNPAGEQRFFLYTTLFAADVLFLFLVRRAALVACMAASILLYTVALTGIGPVVALLYFAAGCYSIGCLLPGLGFHGQRSPFERDALAFAAGAGLWGMAVSLLAFTHWNYAAVHALLLAIPMVAARHTLRERLRALRPSSFAVRDAGSYWAMAVLLYVLGAQFLMSLKPEVSADGIAMHLVVPMHMAAHHGWHFDVSQVSWAVMPMTAEWCYSTLYLLGGEFAAKLLPFACLCLSCALIVLLCRRLVSRAAALLIAAVFAATPAVQLITGAMFPDMLWATFLLAAAVLVVDWTESRETAVLPVAGILFGAAMATKLIAIAFVAPSLLWILVLCFSPKRGIDRRNLAALAQAAVLCAIIGAPPYATAWVKTGNPVFPYFNDVFRSPHYAVTPDWEDPRWQTRFSWHVPFDITFRSSRFLESQNGALGVSWLFLLLLFLTAPRSMFSRQVVGALLVASFFFLFTWSRASYLRYLIPAFPLLLFAFAGYLRALRREQPNLYRTVLGMTVLTVFCGTFLLPSSGYWHKDFCLNPLKFRAEAAQYIEQAAPARVMVDYLNRTAPGEPAAFFWIGIAGLVGRPYTSGTHTFEFFRQCDAAHTGEAVKKLMEEYGIHHFVAPLPKCGQPNLPQLAEFLRLYTRERFRDGCLYVAETREAPLNSAGASTASPGN